MGKQAQGIIGLN
jgi:DNA-directed RNA polymerase III subunit RPC2